MKNSIIVKKLNVIFKPSSLLPKYWSNQYIAALFHHFIGLKLCLIFTVVLLSGALASISQEIDWLIYPEVRSESADIRLDEGVLYDKLQKAYPNSGIGFFQTKVLTPGYSSSALINDEKGGFRYVYINPYTGEIKGDTNALTIGLFIAYLHTSLYLPVIGRSVVNVFGVLTFISLITGLFAYPKFWQHFFKIPRTKHRRLFWIDLHKLIGLWSLWFVLIIGVSGSWWFYLDPLVSHLGAPGIAAPSKKVTLSDNDLFRKPDLVDPVQKMTAKIKQTYPKSRIVFINPPAHNGEAYEFILKSDEVLIPKERQSKVYVSQISNEIIGHYLVSDEPMVRRIDSAFETLHEGSFAEGSWANLTVKITWFLFGIAMTALAISGLIMNYNRTKRAASILYIRKWKKYLVRLWLIFKPWGQPFGVFKYVNILLILGIFVGSGIAITLSKQGATDAGKLYVQKSIGPWYVGMNAVVGLLEKDISPIRENGRADFYVKLTADLMANVKFSYLKIGEKPVAKDYGTLIKGPLAGTKARIRLPKKLTGEELIWLTLEAWDGQVYQTSWLLGDQLVVALNIRASLD